MEIKNVGILAPWTTYYKKVNELFKDDEEVNVVWDAENMAIKLYVSNAKKADALAKIMPTEREFGDIIVTITVYPPNGKETIADLFRTAFEGNEKVVEIFTVPDDMTYSPTYVIFKKEVIQFFNDNLNDAHGNLSTLSEEIAREVFRNSGNVFFCTDNEGQVGETLGQWPKKQ